MPDQEQPTFDHILSTQADGFAAFQPDGVDEEPKFTPSDVSTEVDDESDAEVGFDPKWQDEFIGLMFLGALTMHFRWMGHDFKIRTLTTKELLEVSQVQSRYEGTMGSAKAYSAAIVAACVVSIDGRPLIPEISDVEIGVGSKFEYITKHWFPVVIDVIYNRYLALEHKSLMVLEEMGKRYG